MGILYVSSANLDSNIEYIALSYENVINAVSCTCEGKTLLALQLGPIYSRNEKILLFDEIKHDILSNAKTNEIIITTDTDLFYKISKCKSQNDSKTFESVYSIAKNRK